MLDILRNESRRFALLDRILQRQFLLISNFKLFRCQTASYTNEWSPKRLPFSPNRFWIYRLAIFLTFAHIYMPYIIRNMVQSKPCIYSTMTTTTAQTAAAAAAAVVCDKYTIYFLWPCFKVCATFTTFTENVHEKLDKATVEGNTCWHGRIDRHCPLTLIENTNWEFCFNGHCIALLID